MFPLWQKTFQVTAVNRGFLSAFMLSTFEGLTGCSFISSISNRALRLPPKELWPLLDSIIPTVNKLCNSFKNPTGYKLKMGRHDSNIFRQKLCPLSSLFPS